MVCGRGAVHDYRRAPASEPISILSGLDVFGPAGAVKAFIADRGFLVFDAGTSLVAAFADYLDQAARESCGRCTPCRVGTQRLRDMLQRYADGSAGTETLDEVAALARQLSDTGLCGLGQSCARALVSALHHFREEFRPRPVLPIEQSSFVYTTAPCIEACPSKIEVPKYIDGVKGGKFDFALGVVLDKYSMAATCGRVCVRFCEVACRRSAAEGPVAIRMLKRYAADQAMTNGRMLQITRPQRQQPQRVAVVGAGPAGITCAYKLLLDGFQVDLFDAQQTAGGMAAIGIPSYRLPKDVLKAETEDLLRQLGGRFFYGQRLGRDFTLDALFAQGYEAVFLGYGAAQGSLLGVRNEDPQLVGYQSGVDFLFRVHQHVEQGQPFAVEGDVVVVGGGNVAMDCVRSARRMGARSVHLVYRRTLADMPAEREEIVAAEHEGIIFHCLSNPASLVVENGRVSGVELLTMRQTECDARGRRNVEAVPGSESVLRCDLVIAAIGQQVERNGLGPEDGITLDRWNCISVHPDTLATSRRGVFAGGDCVLGPLTLVNALDHGERAAASIRDYLLHGAPRITPVRQMQQLLAQNRLLSGPAEALCRPPLRRERATGPELEATSRIHSFAEVDGLISKEAAYEEAQRCLRCYRLYSVVTEQVLQAQAVRPATSAAG